MGVYELLVTNDEVRQLAHDRASSWVIKQAGARAGMKSLRDDGWRKAIHGLTTIDEVLRVTKGDRLVIGERKKQ
jgi:general secretion pathway protein E/type IV pilus assembly protein PilB